VFERQQIKICEKTHKVNDADLAEKNIKKSKPDILEWNFQVYNKKAQPGKNTKKNIFFF
jgi:hypothetical protein